MKKLFEPIKIGNVNLRNRIVAAPITKYGYQPSPADDIEALAAKARGGAGLIIIGSVAVEEREGLIYKDAGSLFGHEKPLFNEQLSIIHQYGAKASAELLHCGMFADCRGTDANPVGPCTFVREPGKFMGYEGVEDNQIMDGRTVIGIDEVKMQMICEDYAKSAAEAKRMGFDMVMLHFAHGWLPAEFLSPFFNHRTDAYGGSIENRIRFPMMIVNAVRRAVGKDYPIDMRISACEHVKGGIEFADVLEFLRRIEDQIDMVHISSGLDKLVGATSYIESPSIHPHQINVRYAQKAKEVLHIPVCTVGGITMPEEAETILLDGGADMVAFGRAFIADPDWPNKVRLGHSEDVRPCIRCVSCYSVATKGNSQGCAVNPRYGRELRLRAEEQFATRRKKGVVIGGGPAGMRAALAASAKGHKVLLLEKSARLGGLLRISDHDPIKQDMHNYVTYLINQVKKSKIEVHLGCNATPEMVEGMYPDELIVAVGSLPVKPPIKGIDQAHVKNVVECHEMDMKGDIIVIGGGPSGCEIALSELRKGNHVTLVEMTDRLAAAGNVLYQGAVEELFKEHDNLDIYRKTTCKEILENQVCLVDEEGRESFVNADYVVYSTGMHPQRELAESFLHICYDVKLIGDCVGARRINEATHEGYFAGHFI